VPADNNDRTGVPRFVDHTGGKRSKNHARARCQRRAIMRQLQQPSQHVFDNTDFSVQRDTGFPSKASLRKLEERYAASMARSIPGIAAADLFAYSFCPAKDINGIGSSGD